MPTIASISCVLRKEAHVMFQLVCHRISCLETSVFDHPRFCDKRRASSSIEGHDSQSLSPLRLPGPPAHISGEILSLFIISNAETGDPETGTAIFASRAC